MKRFLVAFFGFALILAAQTTNVSPLNFIPSGTGAAARTVGSKLGDQCSVKDFGVLDDGSDQGVNINKALSACLDVFFPTPATSYASSIPLMLRSGHYLHGGEGAGARGGAYISSTGTGPLLSASFTPHGYWVSDGGATHTGTVGQTCTVTFAGGGGGTATIALTGTNVIAAGSLFTSFVGGTYNPAPTTATLTSGTATCGGTAGNVFIFAPGGGTRDITFQNLYLEDNYGSRTGAGATNIVSPTLALTSGPGIYFNGETDAATFDINDVHILKFGYSMDMASVINSRIGSHTRFDIPLLNCINQSAASTSLTVDGFYCDAPGQDCVHLDGMAGGSWTHNCDSAVRDNVNMGTTVENTGITFFLEMEAVTRYGVLVEGQSHVLGGTCYVVDAVGHRCVYLDNVAQIIINGMSTRNGDYGVYYNGGGSLESFFTDPGRTACCVTFLAPGNYTTGSFSVAELRDPNGYVRMPDNARYVITAGTTTAYTATLPIPLKSFVQGQDVTVKINATNTSTTPTLNINGLGAVNIVRPGSAAIGVGDLKIGCICTFRYNYTGAANEYQLITPLDSTVALTATEAARSVLANASASVAAPTWSTTVDALAYQTAEIPAYVFVTSDFTTSGSGTALEAITGLTWTMAGSTALNIPFHCSLIYHQNSAAVTIAFGTQNATTGPTNYSAKGTIWTSATASTSGNVVANTATTAVSVVSVLAVTITTNFNAELDGFIEQPSGTASVFTIRVSTATQGDTVTVKRGSYCRVG